MDYRVTSKYLANIIERSELPPEDSRKVVKYLNELGDQIIGSGENVEKMYFAGNLAFRGLDLELRFILENIHPDEVLTQQNTTFFVERFGKILNIVTGLRDHFQRIIDDLDKLVLLDEKMLQSANGMNYVELYFEDATPVLDKTHDVEKAKRKLEYLMQFMKIIPDIRNQINYTLVEFNQHRLALIKGRSIWSKFRRRKLVSLEDTEKLYETIQKLDSAAKVFKTKGLESVKRISV
ncbi:9997_t:CDS:1 [Acaulospora colombiana]|uniref:9997_t:CDS:1 n=1 Tax=Acaulospora colombiana TaxID=27376 RepID=A0ACA9L2H8_9GLOM|nr:9997_t:CDS:1 [Acaulospora colombiana]